MTTIMTTMTMITPRIKAKTNIYLTRLDAWRVIQPQSPQMNATRILLCAAMLTLPLMLNSCASGHFETELVPSKRPQAGPKRKGHRHGGKNRKLLKIRWVKHEAPQPNLAE